MLTIHKSLLPKKIQKELKDYPDWLEGTVFLEETSIYAAFLDEKGKVVFRFSRPVLAAHTAYILKYYAFVRTEHRKGVTEGELCELIFHFSQSTSTSVTN